MFSWSHRCQTESDTLGELQKAIRHHWQVHEKTIVKVVHDTSVHESAEAGPKGPKGSKGPGGPGADMHFNC